MTSIRRRLKQRCVGIAGCGGLGSNCAIALARAGIGKLIIADFDTITRSNLDRQYYFLDQVGEKKVKALKENIHKIDPTITVDALDCKLTPVAIKKLFKYCDVIVEAFDHPEIKKMIVETVITEMPDKFLVVGSGLAGYGNNNDLGTRQVGRMYICGDEQRAISKTQPPLAPRVGVVANMQANQVMEILLNRNPNCPEQG
jgi:sulfur carrier protein ThiS adenylyltransferase